MRTFVTVVTGIPRSGTSLVMQMLAAGGLSVLQDDVRTADEDNPRGYYELDAVKASRRDAGWLAGAEGHAVKVVHALLPELPPDRPYRVIAVHRAIGEVLASQRAMLRRRGETALPAREEARLGEIQLQQLETAERFVETVPGAALLRVRHAELLADPEQVSGRLAAFLGGDLDVAAMAVQVDPALHRQRQAGSGVG